MDKEEEVPPPSEGQSSSSHKDIDRGQDAGGNDGLIGSIITTVINLIKQVILLSD